MRRLTVVEAALPTGTDVCAGTRVVAREEGLISAGEMEDLAVFLRRAPVPTERPAKALPAAGAAPPGCDVLRCKPPLGTEGDERAPGGAFKEIGGTAGAASLPVCGGGGADPREDEDGTERPVRSEEGFGQAGALASTPSVCPDVGGTGVLDI
jgi:hypothetical protein